MRRQLSQGIALVPIGSVDDDVLEALQSPLEEVFCYGVRIAGAIPLMAESWNRERGQHIASWLLDALATEHHSSHRVLGVVDVDIFAPGLNFVFGQADVAGRRAVISLWRLRQEFYGLPRDEKLFRERTLKEAVHELGHTYGVGHCLGHNCVMHFSNSLPETDRKGWRFCSVCREEIDRQL